MDNDKATTAGPGDVSSPASINLIPDQTFSYRTKEYWDWRYQTLNSSDDTYDWFFEYPKIKQYLLPYILPTHCILIIGCGNSKLSEELYADGHTNITNVDYSEAVIAAMSARTKDTCPAMRWTTMDMRKMVGLDSNVFDLVLDKGALDALWSDGQSQWDPSDETKTDVSDAIQEIYRVLKTEGYFVFFSFGQPHFRNRLLEQDGLWRSFKAISIGIYHIMLSIHCYRTAVTRLAIGPSVPQANPTVQYLYPSP